ncbi:hypothetical protein PoB_007429600 [Plakobranchus ocellatus]|uniref:Uncharacterized protein n=1 Tax=Plakobranchus ocellatus TaxID=259542 RepID=A0AAV4DVE1_9GAST|nr:hypothetical protein PoB_007429600 [Plakobranchus ocellatus]
MILPNSFIKYTPLEDGLFRDMRNASMDFLHYYENEDQRFTFNSSSRIVTMWWTYFTNNTNHDWIEVEFDSSRLKAKLMLKRKVFLDTLLLYGPKNSSLTRLDNYVNIMVN